MASPSLGENGPNWDLLDCALLDDLPSIEQCLHWDQSYASLPPNHSSIGVEIDHAFGNPDCMKDSSSKKRFRSGACGASDSKAYKEKLRRDKMNDRFQELSAILDPGRTPKLDKTVILSDAVRMVIQLREEAHNLKQQHDQLQGKVTELKAEKNEIRDEKMKLKAEKEKLEQQVKALSTPQGFLPHPPPMHAPFLAPSQANYSKMVPYVGYPGLPMWQFMPPTAVDTSEDHSLRPPVA